MARVPHLSPDELTPEQKRIHDAIAGARGGAVGGPFAIWLRLPEIADKANQFGNVLRSHGTLDRRLFELMILVVARQWSAQYAWFVHERAARQAGVSDAVIEAIRARRTPPFARDDERLVYDIVTELSTTKTLAQASYDGLVSSLRLERTIELMTATGFYTMVAMMLNAFDAPVPGNVRPLP